MDGVVGGYWQIIVVHVRACWWTLVDVVGC